MESFFMLDPSLLACIHLPIYTVDWILIGFRNSQGMLPASKVFTSVVRSRFPLIPAPRYPGQGTWDALFHHIQVAISPVCTVGSNTEQFPETLYNNIGEYDIEQDGICLHWHPNWAVQHQTQFTLSTVPNALYCSACIHWVCTCFSSLCKTLHVLLQSTSMFHAWLFQSSMFHVWLLCLYSQSIHLICNSSLCMFHILYILQVMF